MMTKVENGRATWQQFEIRRVHLTVVKDGEGWYAPHWQDTDPPTNNLDALKRANGDGAPVGQDDNPYPTLVWQHEGDRWQTDWNNMPNKQQRLLHGLIFSENNVAQSPWVNAAMLGDPEHGGNTTRGAHEWSGHRYGTLNNDYAYNVNTMTQQNCGNRKVRAIRLSHQLPCGFETELITNVQPLSTHQ